MFCTQPKTNFFFMFSLFTPPVPFHCTANNKIKSLNTEQCVQSLQSKTLKARGKNRVLHEVKTGFFTPISLVRGKNRVLHTHILGPR